MLGRIGERDVYSDGGDGQIWSCKKAQQASCMGLLMAEVMDIVQREQLVSFIRYVYRDTHEVKTDSLAVNDILENSSSAANVKTIKSVVVKQLWDCDLDISKLPGLPTDGEYVMLERKMALLLSWREKLRCYWMFIASAIDWLLNVGMQMMIFHISRLLKKFWNNYGLSPTTWEKAQQHTPKQWLLQQNYRFQILQRRGWWSTLRRTRTRWLSTESTVDGNFF